MTINELFDKLEKKFNESNLKGNFIFDENENIIIWEYEMNDIIDDQYSHYNEEDDFDFICPDEDLQEIYENDIVKIETYLEKLGILDELTISDFEITNNLISFMIYI
jgi:hypothetical protein